MVQSHLPGGSSVPPFSGCLSQPESTSQMDSRLVQLFSHSSWQTTVRILYRRHLDRFSSFCGADDCDRPTDHATPSVPIGHICVILQCGLTIIVMICSLYLLTVINYCNSYESANAIGRGHAMVPQNSEYLITSQMGNRLCEVS